MDKLSENPAKPAKLKKETKVNVNQLETVGCGFSGGKNCVIYVSYQLICSQQSVKTKERIQWEVWEVDISSIW